ncbi:MAG: flagellar basal body rod protein FlgC [Candidatus Margulisiibacteriota bacterium]
MSLSSALDISVSGIMAEKTHMELIASNTANINTTKSVGGGAYKRKIAVYTETPISFQDQLSSAQAKLAKKPGGVFVSIVDDASSPAQKVYNPGHPDADLNGYVSLPNVSLATEMTDLVYSNQLYGANITVFNATKKMGQDALQIQ